MANDDRVLLTFRLDDSGDIPDQIGHGIGRFALRLVGQVVTAIVQRRGAVARLVEGCHQRLPRRPIVWKAVDQDHEGPLAIDDIVYLNPLIVGKAVLRLCLSEG